MPWCAACDRFLSPNTVLVDGTCPTCRTRVTTTTPTTTPTATAAPEPEPEAHEPDPDVDAPEREHTPIPWHLWLLIAALVVYLGYRAFQGLELVFGL